MSGRSRRSHRLCAALIGCALFAAAGANPAVAAPIWSVDLHHAPTNFSPGGSGDYAFTIANVGGSASSGPITLRIGLPPALSRASVRQSGAPSWSCPGSPGDQEVTCTTSGSIARHSVVRNLILTVNVSPSASVAQSAGAELEGGGAANPAAAVEPTGFSALPAGFGIVPHSFSADSLEADGSTPVREAGAHPDRVLVSLDLTSVVSTASSPVQINSAGNLRNFEIAMPPGFLGNPTAVGECSPSQLIFYQCPRSSQVGRIDLASGPHSLSDFPKTHSLPLFNMKSPRGLIADLGFSITGNPVHIGFSLDPANGYSVVASARDLNESESLLDMRMTLWGVPGDPSHDSERCGGLSIQTGQNCPTDAVAKPFITVPSHCGGEQSTIFRNYDSWQETGVFGPEIAYRPPGQTTDCDRPRFEPALEASPTVKEANSPTGITFGIELPQNENPDALATPPIRDVELTLPAGVRVSPSAADGLESCAPDQIRLKTNDPVTCPDASRLGEATVSTPLIPQPLRGFLYLATPHDNPSGSLFALYLVVADTEDRGVLLKLPGRLSLDPTDGRITASFEDLPQLPFEDLRLSFRSGAQAPLLSGPSCGTQMIAARLSSWARPAEPLELTDSYTVSSGPGGSPCAAADRRPFAPALSAGTVVPTAAASTPFVMRLSRGDTEQPLAQVSATLPPGLSAAIAPVPTCPDAAIAAIPTAEGSAQRQIIAPSCPAESRLGTATIAAGAGPNPLSLSGPAYLAGPDRGAPYSLLVVVPALAGPFDLGTLVSRIAVEVDPITAQLRLQSEAMPKILAGVPIDLRQIKLTLDRPGLIRNPTSCDPTAITGIATATGGVSASLANRFQVGDCAALRFRPRLSLLLSGGLARNGHPALRAAFRSGAAQAGIAGATFTLPAGQLLDIHRVRELCARGLPPERCPRDSRLGHARLWSPLLDDPLEGAIYLREPAHRLPELLADLRSGPLRIVLRGSTATPRGRLRLRLRALPDVPVSKAVFTLAGGRRGILVNSESLCGDSRRARATLSAHSDRRRLLRPRLRLRGRC